MFFKGLIEGFAVLKLRKSGYAAKLKFHKGLSAQPLHIFFTADH